MIPFTRITTFIFFIALLLCSVYAGLALNPHPFMGFEVMLLAALSASLIFVVSLFRRFVTDLIAILWTGYVTQRIIVIYIWPKEIDYQEWLVFDNETMLRVMVFTFLSALALTLGAFFALSRKRKTSFPHLSQFGNRSENIIQPINLYGKTVTFDQLTVIASWMIIVGFFLRSYVMFSEGIGFVGQTYDRESAVLLRLSVMSSSLGFIVFLSSVIYWSRIRHYKTILIALFVTMLVPIFIVPSKAALMGFVLSITSSFYFGKGFVPKKIIVYGLFAVLFTGLLYFSLAEQLRSILLGYQSEMSTFSLNFILTSSADTLFGFSQRMGAFDWFAGIMKVGRDAFYPSANLWIDLQALVNTLVPGDLISPSDDFIDISKLLPILLRGYGDTFYIGLGGHGELIGGLGMAYIYFGELAGPLFFFFWVWGCIAIVNSRMHAIVKLFMINFFLVTTFVGGGFSSMFEHAVNIFYLSFLVYALSCLGLKTIFYHYPLLQNGARRMQIRLRV